ncbi:TonB-dependent receptor family protein [Caldimonas tepidiphila]|uniref:TonB-dependent receptor family protein n=1 Tax=Caldimonas tepidiphila TaxID=2315841 RepID=UPI000E5B4BDF|nr:TonB-dependent receptor [Caldimonas tepidiphila]
MQRPALPARRRTSLPCPRRLPALAAALATAAAPAFAQAPAGEELEPVVVSASRQQQRLFDTPAGIDAVDVEALRRDRPLASLSELLLTVPGLTVRERHNQAQDLQLSIRGFGSRATFGVRGVRLLVDGIPASMPDGQGQTSTAQLRTAQRVEVLRGPVAQLYGNAAGGVVSVFTADPPAVDAGVRSELSGGIGEDGQRQLGLRTTAGDRSLGAVLGLSADESEGFRPHSEMRRRHLNAKVVAQPASGLKLTGVLNSLNLKAQDPLGLTRAQFDANPDQTTREAGDYDTRKPLEQHQLGLVAEYRPGDRDTLSARLYGGHRLVRQTLSIPPSAAPVTRGAGGVVDLDREYGGAGLQWSRCGVRDSGLPWRLTLGVDIDRQTDERLGYDNNGGTQGTLRRDETNRAGNDDGYAQLEWDASERVTLTGGLRTSRVRLSVADRYIRGVNGDDSGAALHEQTSPVLGVLWRASETLNVYANAGRGFETPTLTEVAYRPDGNAGLNLGLQAARSRQVELGLRGRQGGGLWQAAWFGSRTRQEIVPVDTRNGRSSFQNVDEVERRGVELGWQRPLGGAWQLGLGYTWLDASFGQSFTRSVNGSATTVPAGNRLPGIPEHSLGADLGWRFAPGLAIGAEVRAESRVAVDDRNSDHAAGYAVAHLKLSGQRRLAGQAVQWFVRADNVFDRRYAGSVIVNDGNGRFFEPAPGRRWFAGMTLAL